MSIDLIIYKKKYWGDKLVFWRFLFKSDRLKKHMTLKNRKLFCQHELRRRGHHSPFFDQGKDPPVVGKGMQEDRNVLPCFHNFVEIAHAAEAGSFGQWTVDPLCTFV